MLKTPYKQNPSNRTLFKYEENPELKREYNESKHEKKPEPKREFEDNKYEKKNDPKRKCEAYKLFIASR